MQTVKHTLPIDLPYPAIQFHVRSGGGHFHSNRNCPMLNLEQYKHYKYKPMLLSEVKKKNLNPCVCVHDTLCSHHRLTAVGVESILRHCGWEEIIDERKSN